MYQDLTQPATCEQIIKPYKANKPKSRNTKQKIYKLGLVYISSNIKQKERQQLFPAYVKKTLSNGMFSFPPRTSDQQQKIWNIRFSLMVQANFVGFIQYLPNNPTLLIDIQHINFNKLKELTLYQAGIQNLQPLGYLNIPCLQQIDLMNNLCHNFSSLVKMNTPNLKRLCLFICEIKPTEDHSDRVVQNIYINNIDRWSFNLDSLRLQQYQTDQIIISDFSKLAKLKSSPQIISCMEHRIINTKIINRLLKKSLQFKRKVFDANRLIELMNL